MTGEKKCARCRKDAIGFESFGCCAAYVCSDHASSLLLDLAPGTKLSSGECYLERFSPSKDVPGHGSG
ncbi:hypothetical protein [Methanoregula formicica]|uniref:Uncharacterized protein n=1 Tax=Methanoregula formicica (strain DSM 22288 / NBRC 105244 / SMSP) TaxID=593750 RepID=L0HI28_METFS|nr:hypothetical protein [Methanoregula formicica]AGB02983.1 hypothetical protein Metfor_1969 [Methanoregula formicica SMSP]